MRRESILWCPALALLSALGACSQQSVSTPPDPLSFDETVTGCLIWNACNEDDDWPFWTCLSPWIPEGPRTRLLSCVLEATTCEDVLACRGSECSREDPEDPVRCDGDGYAYCYEGYKYRIDCGEGGETCVEIATGGVGCALGTCPLEQEGESSCQGNLIAACYGNGVLQGIDCAEQYLGGTCEVSEGWPVCRGQTCDDATYEPRCDGDRLPYCYDGRLMIMDCVEQPMELGSYASTCVMIDGTPECRAPGPPCGEVPEACECDGTLWRCCLSGSLHTFDCATIGAECSGSPARCHVP